MVFLVGALLQQQAVAVEHEDGDGEVARALAMRVELADAVAAALGVEADDDLRRVGGADVGRPRLIGRFRAVRRGDAAQHVPERQRQERAERRASAAGRSAPA